MVFGTRGPQTLQMAAARGAHFNFLCAVGGQRDFDLAGHHRRFFAALRAASGPRCRWFVAVGRRGFGAAFSGPARGVEPVVSTDFRGDLGAFNARARLVAITRAALWPERRLATRGVFARRSGRHHADLAFPFRLV